MIEFAELKRHISNRQFRKLVVVPLVTFFIAEFIFVFWHLASAQLGHETFCFWNTIKESALTSAMFALLMQLYIIMSSLFAWKNEIAHSFYGGFYRLLGNKNVQQQFAQLENRFSNSTHLTPPLRSLLSDFVMASLASIGENGFAIINARVETYVEFITSALAASEEAVIVCVVRPFWFVTNEIESVTTAPHPIKGGKEFRYGKGTHLGIKPSSRQKFQRWLVIDELVLTEMLFTAYFDQQMSNLKTEECPVCKACSRGDAKCPFHDIDMRLTYGPISDIPELYWFSTQVHKGRNISLVFIAEKHELKKSRAEFTDRVFIKTNDLDVAVIFSFTNLEKGNLQIHWGEQAAAFKAGCVENFDSKVDLLSGKPSGGDAGYLFFDTFSNLIKMIDPFKGRMKVHVDLLKAQVESNFSNGVQDITGDRKSYTKEYLANGSNEFRGEVIKACNRLRSDLESETKSLEKIYLDLIKFYQTDGGKARVPKVAYNLTLDSAHPKCPVRAAEWHYYWNKIIS